MIRIYCSTSVPTKLEAARELKATLSDIFGPEVIAAAEETVRAQHAAAAAAAAAAGEGSSTAPGLNAFDMMGLRSKLDHAHKFCPTNPHQRDVMTRRILPFLKEDKPALILADVLASIGS